MRCAVIGRWPEAHSWFRPCGRDAEIARLAVVRVDACQLDVLINLSLWQPVTRIRPAVGGNGEAHHPLMTYWLLLYGFSMLARYYPSEWSHLLDVDNSKLAVPLELLFDRAQTDVPHMLAAVLAYMNKED
jgi:hypothetical protein